jgi:Holliday junction resolvase RusA-like endonuclease
MLVPIHAKDKELKTWRQEVAQAARVAAAAAELAGPWTGPIRLVTIFYRPRPQGHYGSGKNAGALKQSAEQLRPIQRPDGLKLARAVEDAITSILWVDDSQVIKHEITKNWGPFRVVVEVHSLDGHTRKEF